jgi:hypothetical protein
MSVRVKFTIALILYLTLQAFFFAGVITHDYRHNLPLYLWVELVASGMALGMVWAVIRTDR